MPRVNFDQVPDAPDNSPVPDGKYLCDLEGIATRAPDGNLLETRAGDEMWELRFVVAEGHYAGRNIFDRISFGAKALSRVKLLCSRLGIETTGNVEVTPELIRDRRCWVTVGTEDYVNAKGDKRQKNVVPFAGFDAVEENGNGARRLSEPSDDLPFAPMRLVRPWFMA